MESNDSEINERSRSLLRDLYDNKELNFETRSQKLSEFKILTREKVLKPDVLNQECIQMLVKYSSECQTEAQKCLSNLILNYDSLRERLVDPYATCVEKRLNDILSTTDSSKFLPSTEQLNEVLYYDLRIIFLLSALCTTRRSNIRDRLIDLILRMTEKEADRFSGDNYLLIVESLKTLFNLTLDKCINEKLAGDVIKKLFSIVNTDMEIKTDVITNEKLELTDQLIVNIIHLLTNMPEEVYLRLSEEDVDKVLTHLDNALKTYSRQNFRETVLPTLNVCANVCKYNEQLRKRWFDQIVGSVTDFEKRPEEYDTLRGRLVKLMTSVDVHIKDIAAEFMHALCGGDTEKFITYTGFGNSVAFLSSRGLLSSQEMKQRKGDNSTTEGGSCYQELREKINPITGKVETPRKNPMEGMSEEEKEYHANELANAITKLSNLGLVKPMRMNEEGQMQELHPDSLKENKK